MPPKIKTIRRFNQRYKSFSFSELMTKADEEYLEATVEMDENGNVLSESKFDHIGELEERNSLSYSPEGKLLEHTLLFAMEDVTEKRSLVRDEKGKLLEEVKYYGDDSGERTTYEYNEKDLLTAIVEYDEEGGFVSREVIGYDAEGSMIERVKTDESGNLMDRMVFEKAEDSKVLQEKEFNPDGTLKSTTVITFNETGKEISSYQRTPDGKLITGVLTTYDDKGNVIERNYKDFYSKVVKYEYDEENRLITQELFDGSGLLLRKNMYEYDEAGNLLTEQTFEIDSSRGGKEKHFGTRYEYEFF